MTRQLAVKDTALRSPGTLSPACGHILRGHPCLGSEAVLAHRAPLWPWLLADLNGQAEDPCP